MAYSQRDPAWANILLGFNTSSQWTIGTAGCYVTAIANVCKWAGNDLNPQQINDICKQTNWFANGGEIARDDIPALLCNNLSFVGRTNWSGPTDINFFNDASDPNVTYIIEIDASPAPGIQTHFVMVWSKPDASDLEIDDSWDGVRKVLSRYGSPSAIIQSAMKFTKNVPEPQIVLPYTAEPYVRQMVTIRDTYKYDCNRTDFTDRHNNPIEGVTKGFVFDCQQVYTTQDGSRYYVADPQNSGGYYVPDCDAYIPPPPPPIAPPAAPVTVPPAERYTTITTLMTFPTSADAMSSTNGLTTLKSGTYYVWAKNGKAYQLSTDNMHEPTGNWINTLLNVPDKPKPPVVIPIPSKPVLLPSQVKPGTESDTAWRSSYKSFYHDRHSDLYEVKQHLTMLDYSGKRNPVAVQPGDQMNVTGTFLKDGVMFYRTRSGRDEYFTWFYGISLYDDYGNIQIVKVVDTTPKPTLKNILYWVADDVRRWWDIKTKKEQ